MAADRPEIESPGSAGARSNAERCGDEIELGTQAESPRALARSIGAEHAVTELDGASSAPQRPPPTTADALDKSDLVRSSRYHLYGVVMPLVAIAVSFYFVGDPIVRVAMWIGAAVISIANLGLVYLTSRPDRHRPRAVGVLGMIATAGAQPAILYYGLYSAVVMVEMLAIVYIALGRARWIALATALICIAGHVAMSAPILARTIRDPGVFPSPGFAGDQRIVAEVLVALVLCVGYVLGRWARRTAARAGRRTIDVPVPSWR